MTSAQGITRAEEEAFTRPVYCACSISVQTSCIFLSRSAFGRRIALRAGEESGLLVEAQRLLLVVGKRCLAVGRHAPVAGRGGEPRLAFRAHHVLDEFQRQVLVLRILEHGERLRPQHRSLLRDREVERRVFLGEARRHEFASANDDVHLAGGQRRLAGGDLTDQFGVGLHFQEHVLDGGKVGLGQLGRLLADRERGHPHDRQVVIVDGDLALVFRVGERCHRLHVGGVDLGVVEADRVVAEFFGDAVALAVDDGR